MLSHITRKLSVCDRERSRLLSSGSLLFLLMTGWALGHAARDAFFIKAAGPEKLPQMYIMMTINTFGIIKQIAQF